MAKSRLIVVALIVLLGFSVAKAQRTNTCEACRDSLQKAMYYGGLLSKRVVLQDSLLSVRSEAIKTLMGNNARIHAQKDSLIRVVGDKDRENSKYKKKIRSKNASIGFLIVIIMLSVLL